MNRRWTAAEIEALKAFYPVYPSSWYGWAEVLPDRGPEGIDSCARKLGLWHKQAEDHSADERMARDEVWVAALMKKGLTTEQVDRKMGWRKGRAKEALMRRWEKL